MPIPMLAVRLAVLGEAAAAGSLSRYVERVRQATAADKEFQRQAAARGFHQVPSAGGGTAGLAKVARPRLVGNEQRLQRAQDVLAEALARGTEAEVADALDAVEKLTARVSKQRRGSGFPFLSGAEQRLEEAQKNHHEAVLHGTQQQLDDATAELEKRADAVEKQRRGPSLNIRGPYSRLTAARDQLRKANERGTLDEVKDAAADVRRAWEAVQRIEGGDQRRPAQGLFAQVLQILGQARLGPTGLHMRGVSLNRLARLAPDSGSSAGGGSAGGTQGGGAGAGGGMVGLAKLFLPDAGAAASAGGSAAAGAGTAGLADLTAGAGAATGSLAGLAEMFVALDAASGGLLTPFLILAGIVVLAAVAFMAMVDAGKKFIAETGEAAKRLSEIGAAGVMSGGSPGEVARLGTLGVAPGEVAGAASALSQKLSTGGFAMAAGAKLGLGATLPGAFQPDDQAKLLERGLDRLHDLRFQPKLQRWIARQLDLEKYLPGLNVSDAVFAKKKQDAALGAQVNDQAAVLAANDFNAAMGRIPALLDIVKNAFFKNAMPGITQGLLAVGDAIGKLGEFVNAHPEIARKFGEIIGKTLTQLAKLVPAAGFLAAAGLLAVVKALEAMVNVAVFVGSGIKALGDLFVGIGKFLYDFASRLWNSIADFSNKTFGTQLAKLPTLTNLETAMEAAANAQNAAAQATQDNTKAMQDNSGFLDAMTKGGLYGGGARAQAAIPAHLLPSFGASGMRWQSLHAGVWGLS